MERPTDVEKLYIWRSGRLMGELVRLEKGCSFTFSQEVLHDANRPRIGVSLSMPYTAEPYVTSGYNLPPFFANLLPEGLRFQALSGKLKTSRDDRFSMLAAIGADCIGDIYATVSPSPDIIDFPAAKLANITDQDFNELEQEAIESAHHASIPGEQPKLSASMYTIPVRAKSFSSCILKLSPVAFPLLIENEAFFMECARRCGLQTARVKIVFDKANRPGLLVERFDRQPSSSGFRRIHVEDMCQITDCYPDVKYRLPMRSVAESVIGHTDAAPVQLLRLLQLTVFSYMVGNGDMHAKNISLIENLVTGLIELSPAYDVLSTLPYSRLDQHMALKMDGKDDGFKAGDFVRFFGRYGLAETAVLHSITNITTRLRPQLERIGEIGFGEKTTLFLQNDISRRIAQVTA